MQMNYSIGRTSLFNRVDKPAPMRTSLFNRADKPAPFQHKICTEGGQASSQNAEVNADSAAVMDSADSAAVIGNAQRPVLIQQEQCN